MYFKIIGTIEIQISNEYDILHAFYMIRRSTIKNNLLPKKCCDKCNKELELTQIRNFFTCIPCASEFCLKTFKYALWNKCDLTKESEIYINYIHNANSLVLLKLLKSTYENCKYPPDHKQSAKTILFVDFSCFLDNELIELHKLSCFLYPKFMKNKENKYFFDVAKTPCLEISQSTHLFLNDYFNSFFSFVSIDPIEYAFLGNYSHEAVRERILVNLNAILKTNHTFLYDDILSVIRERSILGFINENVKRNSTVILSSTAEDITRDCFETMCKGGGYQIPSISYFRNNCFTRDLYNIAFIRPLKIFYHNELPVYYRQNNEPDKIAFNSPFEFHPDIPYRHDINTIVTAFLETIQNDNSQILANTSNNLSKLTHKLSITNSMDNGACDIDEDCQIGDAHPSPNDAHRQNSSKCQLLKCFVCLKEKEDPDILKNTWKLNSTQIQILKEVFIHTDNLYTPNTIRNMKVNELISYLIDKLCYKCLYSASLSLFACNITSLLFNLSLLA